MEMSKQHANNGLHGGIRIRIKKQRYRVEEESINDPLNVSNSNFMKS